MTESSVHDFHSRAPWAAAIVWLAGASAGLSGCAAAVVEPSDPHRPQPHGDAAAETFVEHRAEVVGSPRQGYEPFEVYDTTGDGVIDEAELRAFSAPLFARLDRNDDGQLGPQEVGRRSIPDGPYRDWDLDHDGTISKQEFMSGRWNRYDADRSRGIDEEELTKGQAWENRYGIDDPSGGHPGY